MKTVKVRIAVAVGSGGEWSAFGWSCRAGRSDEDAMECAINGVTALNDDHPSQYFIEAELLVPEVQTIQGAIAPRGPE